MCLSVIPCGLHVMVTRLFTCLQDLDRIQNGLCVSLHRLSVMLHGVSVPLHGLYVKLPNFRYMTLHTCFKALLSDYRFCTLYHRASLLFLYYWLSYKTLS